MTEMARESIDDLLTIKDFVLDNGRLAEIFHNEYFKNRVTFQNEYTSFTPVGWIRLDRIWYPLGYKVVTEQQQSLGLRKNPNIMTFPVGEWVSVPESDLVPGMGDFGGIWTALRKGSVKTLMRHCENTWQMKTKGFLAAIDNPVYANSYRIKSQRVMLLSEQLCLP